MHDVHDTMAAAPVNGAHDLLMRLYREIGISAVAAALEVSRLPEPAGDRKAREERDFPCIQRGNVMAA